MDDLVTHFRFNEVKSGAFGKGLLTCDKGDILKSISPIDGALLGSVRCASKEDYDKVISEAQEVFLEWRKVPAPERGNLIREVGNALRDSKKMLGLLVTSECGKTLSEGEGEVQEAIDIADFAVGLSRQLYGKTMHSERPAHRMYEQWHSLGIVGVITAFNFPAAVWAWNAMIAAVCGDVVVWKPSELTPLTALAVNSICREVLERRGFGGVFSLVVSADASLGESIAADKRIPLVSATGSCRMGKSVACTVAERFGRSILELGGNNAVVVLDDADLNLVIPAVLFGAVGTAGQRCTSIRRLYVHHEVHDVVIEKLKSAYLQVRIGDPRNPTTMMGPLIDSRAVDAFKAAVARVPSEGGSILYGGEIVKGAASDFYVQPTLVKAHRKMNLLREETFAPILYVVPISSLEEGIGLNNDVSQGLSSAIFTNNLQSAERFLSYAGSDCGIANVNIGTSGAEIGGAFGGEKDTGGGREAGSDSWKQYMRRQTSTINFSDQLPLAQGVKFEV